MSLFEKYFNGDSTAYLGISGNTDDAVYVCNREGKMVYINEAAEKLDGYSLADVVGEPVSKVYGLDEKTSPMLRALATETPVVNQECAYCVNGRNVVQICSAGPFYEDRRLAGVYAVQRNLPPSRELSQKQTAEDFSARMKTAAICKVKEKDAVFSSREDFFSGIIGDSDAMRTCVERSRLAAKTNSSVLLIGATGSGKELFAHAIHNAGSRKNKPFLALNCATIPETLIEGVLFGTTRGVYTGALDKEGLLAQAGGGTVFLDEINSMPLASQAKLLRVLEEKRIMKLGSNKEVPIDIRLISSINEFPSEALKNGHLREDFLYRLSVVQVNIPSLSERKEDIPLLVDYFINHFNQRFQKHVLGVNPEVRAVFDKYSWPGNVRQLKACIESAMIFTEDESLISMDDLPVYVLVNADAEQECISDCKKNKLFAGSGTENVFDEIRNNEIEKIKSALRDSKGNITSAAKTLGMSRQSLSYRLKKYGLKR